MVHCNSLVWEVRRETFTASGLVTTQRSILGPPTEGLRGPSWINLQSYRRCALREPGMLWIIKKNCIVWACKVRKYRTPIDISTFVSIKETSKAGTGFWSLRKSLFALFSFVQTTCSKDLNNHHSHHQHHHHQTLFSILHVLRPHERNTKNLKEKSNWCEVRVVISLIQSRWSVFQE